MVIGFQPIAVHIHDRWYISNLFLFLFFLFYCSKNIHIPLTRKRLSNSSTWFSCCQTVTSISKKDVLVRNPQKVHFAKKIIVGKQFRKLLKALYREHPKAAQAINGKFQLSESKGKEEGNITSINNIEDRSEAAKNKTITELRSAILKLLEKLKKKANSSQRTGQNDEKQENAHKLPERNNFSKTAKTKIQESYNTESTRPSSPQISAKGANFLDLLNFFSRMKTVEGAPDGDSSHRHGLYNLNGMEMNGLNGIADAKDVLSPELASPMDGMNDQGQRDFLPGSNMQMQEINLAAQRKRIEDQMANQLAQLQRKFKLLQQQQEVAPLQSLQNDQISNAAPDLQYPIAAPPTGTMPFGLTGNALLNQAQPIHQVNPYFSMNRPLTRYRTRLPFSLPVNSRFAHRMNDEDLGDDVDDDDDEEQPPRNYPAPEDEDAEDDEEGYTGPDDER